MRYTFLMDDRSYLHDAEVLLGSLRSSAAMLAWIILRSLFDGLILGIGASILAFLLAFFAFSTTPAWGIYVAILAIAFTVVLIQRIRIWKHALFRVTSERILLQDPKAFFHSPMHTVKWLQYQESHTGHRTFFDFFAASRPLCVKHGTADALNEVCYPSLRYAEDLKHYLDKVDSAVRRNDLASIKPFVAKPRGLRTQPDPEHPPHHPAEGSHPA